MVVIDDEVKRRARQAIDFIAQTTPVRAGFLFGSQATGTANEWSDIDVAAFIEGASQLGVLDRLRLGVATREQVGDDIEVHFFPAESLTDPPPAGFAKYVLQHGIKIF